ncbi:pyrokinin-1 receptor, partial [Halyomorpha halys]|uniref:pyrokinin-1 receptor n=1 Tax=Halyomorpha halys TaxID=286706 RepID=UPI0034D33977
MASFFAYVWGSCAISLYCPSIPGTQLASLGVFLCLPQEDGKAWFGVSKIECNIMDDFSVTDSYEMEFSNITDLFTTTIPERIDSSSPWGPSRDPLYLVVPMTVLYSLIFVTGLVGNISTCIVIYRNRSMQTTTNLYLFSMAVSDLLLLTSGLPQEVYILWSKYPYIFGEVCCFLQGLISEASSNATVLTITAFTVERYIAICHPFLSHTVSKVSRAVKFIIFIWLMAFLSAIPQAIQFGLVYATDNKGNVISEEYKLCSVKTRTFKHSFELSAVLFFFFPMSVITVLYILIGIRLHRAGDSTSGSVSRGSRKGNAKSNKRVIKMLVVVVVAFFICWAPFQAQRLFAMQAQGKHNSPRMVFFYQCITYISGPLYYLSTTVNPFLYNIMSLKFRAAFKEITKCRFETSCPKYLSEYSYAKAVHRIRTSRCVT